MTEREEFVEIILNMTEEQIEQLISLVREQLWQGEALS